MRQRIGIAGIVVTSLLVTGAKGRERAPGLTREE